MVGKERVGKFMGVTPLTNFRILETPEDLPAVVTPSKDEILTTEMLAAS